MSIRIGAIPVFKAEFQTTKPVDNKKTHKTEKVVLAGLAALGVTAAVLLAVRKKKPNVVKEILGKNPKTESLTEAEKEKLIRELQARTNNPDTKEEIRKLVENGEWDKLG